MGTPNFAVAGAARSGTTAVIEALRLHPQVFVTQPKEPHYLAFHGRSVDFKGPGDHEWVNKVAVTDRDEYLRLFDGARGHVALGEGSVTTLYYARDACDEVLRINAKLRVIVILREPVDRAYSSYMYLRARGVETEDDFVKALALEQSRRDRNWHHLWHYTGMSRYASDLLILQETLGHDQVGVWFYDELLMDFEQTMAEIVSFLGLIPFGSVPSLPKVNASGTPRSQIGQRAIRFATRHQAIRGTLKHLVGFNSRERIRSAVLRRDDLSPAVASQVQATFEDDLQSLSLLISGPKPSWLRDSI